MRLKVQKCSQISKISWDIKLSLRKHWRSTEAVEADDATGDDASSMVYSDDAAEAAWAAYNAAGPAMGDAGVAHNLDLDDEYEDEY
jgi:hypothetical protein